MNTTVVSWARRSTWLDPQPDFEHALIRARFREEFDPTYLRINVRVQVGSTTFSALSVVHAHVQKCAAAKNWYWLNVVALTLADPASNQQAAATAMIRRGKLTYIEVYYFFGDTDLNRAATYSASIYRKL